MKYAIGLCAVLLVAQPALAWEINSDVTKKSWSHAAFQADKDGGVELQFYCDNEYPDDIQMLVFTDVDADGSEKDFPSVAVKTTIDDQSFDELAGYYDSVDDERVVVIDTIEDERVRDVVAAARNAKHPIVIDFEGRTVRFGTDDITPTLASFTEGCNG